jgi:hypothetical protein
LPYQADDLLTEVRRGGSLAAAAATGTADADLLAHADNELRDTLVPLMLGVQEELYQRVFDTTVTSGLAPYRVNKRAALSRINTVQWVNSDGSGHNLERLDPKRVLELGLVTTTTGTPSAYCLEGSRVVLYPTPGSGTLRLRAFVRPSRLAVSGVGAAPATATTGNTNITGVSGTAATTYVLTITNTATVFSTSTPVDVVSGTPSFEHLALDVTPSAAGTTSITVAGSAFSTAPAIGDYVCAPDTTPFIQLPVELHPALFELTIARLLRSLGKLSEAKAHADRATEMVVVGIAALTPRVDTAERKIVGGPHFRNRGRLSWGLL